MTALKETYFRLLNGYTTDKHLMLVLWEEIERKYSEKQRFYHSLTHLENLLVQLDKVVGQLQNWDVVLFSLYYHDIVYSAVKSDNEEKSAGFAENRMLQLGVSSSIVESCKEQILATKSHTISVNEDTNYFTDADLSILGQDWECYAMYSQNVRKEYRIYPDFLYKPGRKKVLKHFLEMPRIYKTTYFYQKLELKARENLQKEIDLL